MLRACKQSLVTSLQTYTSAYDQSPLGNRPPQLHSPLPRIQPLLLLLHHMRPLLHDLLTLRKYQFNMARIRHVGINLSNPQKHKSANHIPNHISWNKE